MDKAAVPDENKDAQSTREQTTYRYPYGNYDYNNDYYWYPTESKVKYIVGGCVGGFLFLAIVIASIVIACSSKAKKEKMKHKAVVAGQACRRVTIHYSGVLSQRLGKALVSLSVKIKNYEKSIAVEKAEQDDVAIASDDEAKIEAAEDPQNSPPELNPTADVDGQTCEESRGDDESPEKDDQHGNDAAKVDASCPEGNDSSQLDTVCLIP